MKFGSTKSWLSIVGISMLVIGFASATAQAQSGSADGAALYKTKCAMCHGPDGSGKTPMGQKLNIRDLHSADVQKQSDADLSHVIEQGKGKMPAAKTLSPDQVKQLVTYVRELGKK